MKVLALANFYRADHMARLAPYRPLNPAASSWNTALFTEMGVMGLDLHIAQFLPIRRHVRIAEPGLTFHYLPYVPRVDNFTSLIKRARAAALVRELRPDVVHGIGSEHGYAWAAVGHGVPSAVTIHGYLRVINTLAGHASLLKRWFLVPEERRALLGADRVIAINEYMRQRFVDDGCDRSRTVVVPNALNPVYLREAASPAPRTIDILMVGTLHPLKNQHLALELFARLQRDHGFTPRVTVVGASTTESRDYEVGLHASKEALGLQQVTFAGKKSATELAGLYRASRFLLHISEFETDSLVVAEALACGALPVVNPVAGLAFRVKHGHNGYHLPITDLTAAAASLARFVIDDAVRGHMASVGRSEVLAERRPRSVAEATVRVYEGLARGGLATSISQS